MFEKELHKRLLALLKPGDLLFYSSNGIFGRLIKLKTSSKVTHVATYAGNGKMHECVEGVGVHAAPLRLRDIALVRRPHHVYDAKAALVWFLSVNGQKYDYLGLFLGFIARKWGRQNNKMWCSEFCTRQARAAGIEPFDSTTDADAIHPGHLAFSSAYRDIIKIDCKKEVWYERLAADADPNWAGGTCKVAAE